MTDKERLRRARGDAGVYWDQRRKRFVAEVTVGFDARGKRIRRTGSGRSKTAALKEMRKRAKEYEQGLAPTARFVTVAHVVEDWLKYERSTVGEKTREGNEDHYRLHIKPHIGGRRVQDLRPDEVDRWLLGLTRTLSTSTIKQVRGVLRRSLIRAMRDGVVERNVVNLCPAPKGRAGRKSKSLTLQQASDILERTQTHHMHAYIVVSLLTGLRPEEVRALRWEHVHLDAEVPYVEVWRSVRSGGDVKTRKSRRTLAVSGYAASMFRTHHEQQELHKVQIGDRWREHGLVFPSQVGTEQDAHNVRRMFRDALELVPGLDPKQWTPYELRHSFVSILSQSGLAIEEISRLMGHSGTAVTELVYRHELRPVLESGAVVMDSVFGDLRVEGTSER